MLGGQGSLWGLAYVFLDILGLPLEVSTIVFKRLWLFFERHSLSFVVPTLSLGATAHQSKNQAEAFKGASTVLFFGMAEGHTSSLAKLTV